ncbi:hypothetical protein HA402_001080 [Bradysia odoriphaga]|nr:hypothetical protein HA402_001080 [Bradysia odoriphaga]
MSFFTLNESQIHLLGEIVVADVIDSDSWRLWPSGDKRLMKDKQVYRNLTTVAEADLETIKNNFIWISDQLDQIVARSNHMVVIFMGSPSDQEHCKKIAGHLRDLGVNVQTRISSAHKATQDTLKILRKYESDYEKLVFIAVAGRSNGLGPVLSGNTTYPVINCPPVKPENVNLDVWSSLNVPSGLGCSTVLYPEAAALQAAQIIGLGDFMVWSKLRVKLLSNLNSLRLADQKLNA